MSFLYINFSPILCSYYISVFPRVQDDPDIRKRVKIAIGLLVGAKVLNVFVPFIFKYAVDTLNAHTAAATGTAAMGLATAPATVATVATSLLVGCKDTSVPFRNLCWKFLIKWNLHNMYRYTISDEISL